MSMSPQDPERFKERNARSQNPFFTLSPPLLALNPVDGATHGQEKGSPTLTFASPFSSAAENRHLGLRDFILSWRRKRQGKWSVKRM
jgi:hypothetical protein